MKVRNILIGLLVVLMAFVFISCEDEPEPQPQPAPAKDVVYKLSTTKSVSEGYFSNDKPRLVFTDTIEEGDILSLQFRSEREVYEFDIRNGSGKWVYQQDSSALTSYEVGEDGWITITYEFGSKWYDGGSVDYTTDGAGFDIRFRGHYFAGDAFEVKNVKINNEIVPLKEAGMDYGFTLTGFTAQADDSLWPTAKNYAVIYSIGGRPGDDDSTPKMEKVDAGATPTATAVVAQAGFDLEIFTQYDEKGVGFVEESKITLEQLKALSIEKDTIIYLKYTGVPRTVTFKIGEDLYDQKVVANGSPVTKPAADPEKDGGYQFAEWLTDADVAYDFGAAVTADTTLYASFDKVWTVTFDLNGETGTAPEAQVIVEGQKATKPTDPKTSGKRFQNWKLDSAVFNFDTAIIEDITLVADWIDAETVNFTYDLNYLGAPAAEVIPTFVGEPATSTKPEDPSRAEYVFLGWFDAATAGTEYTFTEDVTVAKTLYAYWADAPIVKLTASKGRNDGWDSYDKFELVFTTTGANKTIEEVKNGDVLSIKFRTTRNPDQFNVRTVTNTNGDQRWVYEQSSSHLTSYDTATYAEAGNWIVATYEFGDYADRVNGDKTKHEMTDALYEGVIDFAFHFRGDILAGDYIEIKSILWNDEPIDIVKAATAALGKSGDVVRSADYITVIDIEDSIWGDVTYNAFFFANPTDGGGTAYSKASTVVSATTVANGGKLSAPSAPSLDGFTFGGWSTAKDGSDPWDFENDTVGSNTYLYAIWTPVTP